MAALSKKGTEAIIAVVLVIMITVAAAGSFFFWYSRVQHQAQGRAEQSTTTFLNQMVTCVKLPSFTYNLLTNESEVTVQNCGASSLIIGDGDDNMLVTSEPCAFTVNSGNCDVCPLTIGPNAFGKFVVNFNKAQCSGTQINASAVMASEGNIQHGITFSVDKTAATASKSFVPTKVLSCDITLSEPSDFSIGDSNVCVDYTKTFGGNVAQTFALSAATAPNGCMIVQYHEGHGCTGSVITQETMQPHTTGNFSMNLTWAGFMDYWGCNVITNIKSLDLATCSDDDLLNIHTECDDGLDNDWDGFIDFGSDANCTSTLDTSELV